LSKDERQIATQSLGKGRGSSVRQSVKDYLVRVLGRFPVLEPIYEIGSYRVEGQEEFADLRPFFPGKVYVGCDMRKGLGVDRIEDVHSLKIRGDSIGTVLIFDTLEHVENVHQAMKEIHRVLEPGGMVILSSVMKFPIHDYPSDYWRFTPKAFELLLKPFALYEVEFDGDPQFPDGIYGLGVKEKKKPLFKSLSPNPVKILKKLIFRT
jgi:SAM-dependent methyltransferase